MLGWTGVSTGAWTHVGWRLPALAIAGWMVAAEARGDATSRIALLPSTPAREAAPQPASWSAPAGAGRTGVPQDEGKGLFTGVERLDRPTLVRKVLERNPGIEAARRAWDAARARQSQVTALEDPMLSYSFAPLSVVGNMRFGQEIRIGQRLPFPGQRGLEGAVAVAEAEAMEQELEATRRELAFAAASLLEDYLVLERSLDIHRQHRVLLQELKAAAEAQYAAGRASQPDLLMAEVELGMLEEEVLMQESERDSVVAELNGLLHRAPRMPLPPPARSADEPAVELGLDSVEALALEHRPELRATAARIRASEAALRLAHRQFLPELDLMASYNSMWDMPEHRWMAGVSLNLPLQLGRRSAAVDEAQAELARMHAEAARTRDEIRVEVTRAHRRVQEARRVVALYQDRLLAAARDRITAARAGFVAGQNAFLDLIAAERSLRDLQLRAETTRAELQRRLAALERAVGRTPGLDSGDER